MKKLPNISRFISESFHHYSSEVSKKFQKGQRFLAKVHIAKITIPALVVCCVLFLIFSFVVAVDLYNNIQKKNKVLAKRVAVLSEIARWENTKEIYKGYRDAYFNLAMRYYQLRDFGKSKENLQKALELDPNFVAGKRLEKILGY